MFYGEGLGKSKIILFKIVIKLNSSIIQISSERKMITVGENFNFNPRTSRGGSNGHHQGFADLKIEALKQSK